MQFGTVTKSHNMLKIRAHIFIYNLQNALPSPFLNI